jgi:hypothetical protein
LSDAALTNAERANRSAPQRKIDGTFLETGVGCGSYRVEASSAREIVMASFSVSRFVLATISGVTGLLCAHAALASQGPGVGPGSASSFTQLAMAIIVYGASALVVGVGLIGAARQRWH